MDVFWLEATPWDPDAAAAATVRACSADLSAIVLFGGGAEWLPVLDGGPTFSTVVFSGTFSGSAEANRGSLSLIAGAGEIDDWARLSWYGRRVRVWTATITTGAGNLPVWPSTQTLIFDGIADTYDPDEATLHLLSNTPNGRVADATYAGTGGMEGPDELTGTVKPFAAGQLANYKPVLVDSSLLLFQVHGYGPIQEFTVIRERGLELDQPFVYHTSTAALLAATVPETEIHVCLAAGAFRIGFTPAGDITADFKGDAPGGVYLARTCAIVARLLVKSGWDPTMIDATGCDAVDTLLPWDIGWSDTSGQDILDALTALMLAAGGYWGVDQLGTAYVGIFDDDAAAFSIGEDGLGDYDIDSADHLPTRAPYWRNRVAYAHNPNPVTYNDTEGSGATADQLADIETALTSAAYAQALLDGVYVVYFQATEPTSPSEGDWWYDSTGDEWNLYHSGAFVPTAPNNLVLAISVAAGASAIADGKINTYVSETAPTASALGDLWIKPSTKVTYRWDGSTWGSPVMNLATTADQITYVSGSSLADKEPAEVGANVTVTHTAAAIVGQGTLATASSADYATQVSGSAKPDANATVGAIAGVNLLDAIAGAVLALSAIKTILGTSAAFTGQGALATLSTVDWASLVTGTGKPADYATVGAIFGTNILETPGGATALLSAFKTLLGTAAAISGQGTLATLGSVGTSTIDDGSVTAPKIPANTLATSAYNTVNSGGSLASYSSTWTDLNVSTFGGGAGGTGGSGGGGAYPY